MRHIRKDEAHLYPEAYELQQQRYQRYRSNPKVRERNAESQRKRRAANLERERARTRKSEHARRLRRYGITQEQLDFQFELQGKCCCICKIDKPGGRGVWHIDHCHSTGRFRSILCHHCNILLGNAKEDKMILAAAIQYLEKHSCAT